MSRFLSSALRTVVLGAAGSALLAGLAVTAPAKADFKWVPLSCKVTNTCFKYIPLQPKPQGWGGPGFGPAFGAAMVGGMALGAIAASSASAQQTVYADGCYRVRRRAVDEDGNVYIRRVTVCE